MDMEKFGELSEIKERLDSLEDTKIKLECIFSQIRHNNNYLFRLKIDHPNLRDAVGISVDINIMEAIYKEICNKYDHVKKSFEEM